MQFFEQLNQVFLSIGSVDFTFRQLLAFFLFLVILFCFYQIIHRYLFPRFFQKKQVSHNWRSRIRRSSLLIFISLLVLGFLWIFGLDVELKETKKITIRISTLIQAILIIQIARILDWIISKVILHNYYISRDVSTPPRKAVHTEEIATRTVQYIVFVIAILIIINSFNINYTLFEIPQKDQLYPIKISNIITFFLILLLARIFIWIITQLILYTYYRKERIDRGRQYAINQLVSYIVYIVAIIAAIDNLGIKMTIFWGGAAALLVGIGLGLQEVFKDLTSGIILLFERTVEIGDIIEISGTVGMVRKIGLRTSLVQTRDNIMLLVPNSKLVSENVINWSHTDSKARFSVSVGVAYGSDTELVRSILLEAARRNKRILDYPKPSVRFVEFGDSSLDFKILFWSKSMMVIENVKSELRFTIDFLFRENKVTIPFPQRDVWLRNQNIKDE